MKCFDCDKCHIFCIKNIDGHQYFYRVRCFADKRHKYIEFGINKNDTETYKLFGWCPFNKKEEKKIRKILIIDNCDDCKFEESIYDNCGDLLCLKCNKIGRELTHKTYCSIPHDCSLEDLE